MKEKLLALLALLVALIQIHPDEADAIELQKKKIQLKRDEIDTFHGDHELNDDQTKEAIDDLVEVGAAATPDSDHENVPYDVQAELSTGKGPVGPDYGGTGVKSEDDLPDNKSFDWVRAKEIYQRLVATNGTPTDEERDILEEAEQIDPSGAMLGANTLAAPTNPDAATNVAKVADKGETTGTAGATPPPAETK